VFFHSVLRKREWDSSEANAPSLRDSGGMNGHAFPTLKRGANNPFPTLKRGANNHCAYGADLRRRKQYASLGMARGQAHLRGQQP
jgi:hypothetical protein